MKTASKYGRHRANFLLLHLHRSVVVAHLMSLLIRSGFWLGRLHCFLTTNAELQECFFISNSGSFCLTWSIITIIAFCYFMIASQRSRWRTIDKIIGKTSSIDHIIVKASSRTKWIPALTKCLTVEINSKRTKWDWRIWRRVPAI